MGWRYPFRVFIKNFSEAASDFLFPVECRICHRTIRACGRAGICAECWGAIRFTRGPTCGRCGLPLPSEGVCHRCQGIERYFVAVFPVVAYEGAAREAIHLLKYDGKTDLARPLGEMMALHALDELGDFAFDCVVPVPLSLRRLRQRGYNQSLLLALEVGRHLRKPVLDVLARIRDTVPQSDLGSEERRKNVRGAFAVKSPEDIAEKIVMLVDDIFTTGATADECAFALRIAGAKSVYVFALSRA